MKFFMLVCSLALTLGLALPASAHIREPGGCDGQGYCEYFYGDTQNSSGESKDPVTVVYFPSGSWDPMSG
jgi:hypothetical protein